MIFDPYAHDLKRAATQQEQPTADTKPAAEALRGVPPEACALLWRGLLAAVEGTLDLCESIPAGVKHEPPVFTVQHAGKLCFDPATLRHQTLAGWHRLMGLELRLTAQILEALIVTGDTARYYALLGEQCERVGQLYGEVARRAGVWMAWGLLAWELRLLRYRASAAVAPLIY
jgi:hypothetical protein